MRLWGDPRGLWDIFLWILGHQDIFLLHKRLWGDLKVSAGPLSVASGSYRLLESSNGCHNKFSHTRVPLIDLFVVFKKIFQVFKIKNMTMISKIKIKILFQMADLPVSWTCCWWKLFFPPQENHSEGGQNSSECTKLHLDFQNFLGVIPPHPLRWRSPAGAPRAAGALWGDTLNSKS